MSDMRKCKNEGRLCMCSGECMRPPTPLHPLYTGEPTYYEIKSILTSHHAAEIAKRDRSIELLQARIIGIGLAHEYLADEIAELIGEADAILKGEKP